VFRNCVEVVRVKIVRRESSKVPAGRLFNFHGKLFQLQFSVELESDKTGRDGSAQNKDMDGASGDGFDGANGGKIDDGNGANSDPPNAPGNGGSSSSGGNRSGNQFTQRGNGTEGSRKVLHEVTVLKGEEIFSLLFQRGAIGSASQFNWCEQVSDDVLQEVDGFWQEEEQSFSQSVQMAEEDVQEVQLPEELFSSKEDGDLCGV
jgi:hypothetical protein